MKAVNENFEVAVFTAGEQWYADPIIDYLDPTGELIKHRFYRHHTTYIKMREESGIYVKDLRILDGIDLRDVLIIDN